MQEKNGSEPLYTKPLLIYYAKCGRGFMQGKTMKIIIGILITAAALWLTTAVVPGIRIESSLISFLLVAAVFGLVNAFIRPVVRLLSLPATILTLGLFLFVINALMLMLTAGLVGNAMSIEGEGMTKLWWALIGSVVISIATMVFGWIMPDKD